MLKGFKEAPVSGGDSLCRMVLLLKLRGLKEVPMPRVGPCAAERRPCAAQRRPLCREEVLCAGRSYSSVLRGLKEAPVSGGGSLCRMVLLLYAEEIEGGPYAERRPLCRREEAPVPRGPSVPEGILC